MRKKNLKDFLFVTIIIFLIFYTIVLKENSKRDEDYKKLDLNLKSYNINYYTVYEEKDSTGQYKVYKLNLMGQQEEFIEKLKKSKFWSKNKFYEYIMMRFYDMVDNDMIEIDREDLFDKAEEESYVLYKFKMEKPFTIVRDNDVYVVKGDAIEKLFRMTNFNTEEAYERFSNKLRRMGVDEELEKMGIKDGDTVRILDFEFEWTR